MQKRTILRPLPLRNVTVQDSFWNKYTALVTDRIIPYQYQVLHDQLPGVPESHCIKNFRIAAGLEEGQFRGCSDYLSREHTLPALLTLSPKSGIFYSRKLCSGGTFYEKPHLSWH